MTLGSEQLSPIQLSNQWLLLRPVHPSDYEFHYALATENGGARWRFRSNQPTFESFVSTFGQHVLCQFTIIHRSSGNRVGLAIAYRADFRNQSAYIGLIGTPVAIGAGWMPSAGSLLIDYLFSTYDFHKLWMEVPGFNVETVRSSIGLSLNQEGLLTDYERFQGRWWDLHILSYTCKSWLEDKAKSQNRIAELRSEIHSRNELLDFDEFVMFLTTQLNLDPSVVSEDSLLVEDLGFDSIQILECLMLMEDLGSPIPDTIAGDMLTIADLHFLYLQYSAIS